MILEVEFVLPHRDFQCRQFLFDVVEEIGGGTEAQIGENEIRLTELVGTIEHGASWTAAVIADTVEMHDFGRVGHGGSIDLWHPDGKVFAESRAINAAGVIVRENT